MCVKFRFLLVRLLRMPALGSSCHHECTLAGWLADNSLGQTDAEGGGWWGGREYAGFSIMKVIIIYPHDT